MSTSSGVRADMGGLGDPIGSMNQRFRVVEGLLEDAKRGIVRVSQKSFDQMGIAAGSVVSITGSCTTNARLFPGLAMQCRDNEIMMDGVVRENAGVGLNREVSIALAISRDAVSVVLSPLSPSGVLDRDEDFAFLRRYISGIPLTAQDKLVVTLLGSKDLPFRVVGTAPSGPVTVRNSTVIRIKDSDSVEGNFAGATYEDIGGLTGQVRLVREITELPLRHPDVFSRLGIEPPKGILLYGPPGTGKTLIARAVAHESGAHFVYINGPEIMNKYYGETEARLRSLFDEAGRKAPSIIFLDEMDALAPKRSEVIGDVEKRVVGQLLGLMDGLVSRGQVVVIGATNMPSLLDPALRRPGRFDREILIPVPDRMGRSEIFRIHTRGMALGDDVDLEELATMTHGYTGADVAALCRESGMLALRHIMPQLVTDDPNEREELLACLRVTMGDFVEAARVIQPSVTREFFTQVPDTTWEDIGGLVETKRTLEELIVLPLQNSRLAVRLGATAARGVLLSGRSGTGKTVMARAVASRAKVNFISVLGASLFSRWFGESERGLRELFLRAKQASPCILCIDEIDALAAVRSGQSAASERLVSQLLMELDGLAGMNDLVVIGTTNRIDLIDPAFLRTGRFEVVEFPTPGLHDRVEIFRVHLSDKPIYGELDLGELALLTEGFTGADIFGACRRASFGALRSCLEEPGASCAITMLGLRQAIEEVKPTLRRA